MTINDVIPGKEYSNVIKVDGLGGGILEKKLMKNKKVFSIVLLLLDKRQPTLFANSCKNIRYKNHSEYRNKMMKYS